MDFRWYLTAFAILLAIFPCRAQQNGLAGARKTARAWASEPMVDLAKACPTIRIELRYASKRNFTNRPVYPANAHCFARQSVARCLQYAQDELRERGFGLKIWDAYRPAWAQKILWQARPNLHFVQPPDRAASMHTRGVAVDATLVDLRGRELRMPTDFDNFTPAASMYYVGGDPIVAKRLDILQTAMAHAGFVGMRAEWWHFVARGYETSPPVDLDIRPRKEGNVF